VATNAGCLWWYHCSLLLILQQSPNTETCFAKIAKVNMIEEMRVFLAVVDAGSLSRAARERDLAVSSVTRKIDQLESELGAKLLLRNSRSIRLTDAGQQFIVSARHILNELDDAKAALQDAISDPRGRLSVTAPSSYGRRYVLPAVISFMKLYPQIEVELHLNDHTVDLFDQRVDVAIRIGVLSDSDFIATPIAKIRRIACASPAYLEQHGRPLTPDDLLKHNCLTLVSPPVPAGWWAFSGVNNQASLPVKGGFRSDDTEALLAAALDGLGIVHLADWLVGDKIASGKLVPLLTEYEISSISAIHAVRLPGRSHNLRAKLFINHMKSQLEIWNRGE